MAVNIMYIGAIGGIGGAETAFTVLSDVNCIGNESTILECPSLTSSICVSQEIATVICQGKLIISKEVYLL